MNADDDIDLSVFLHDDSCWIYDPEALMPDSGVEGVLAVQYRAGGLYYLDGETRKWLNVEADKPHLKAAK